MPNDGSGSPSIAIPKFPKLTGGAGLGYGEHFQLDTATGSARFEVPIVLPEARALTPSLFLRYASGNPNGLFGVGFALETAAISRRTSLGVPRYDGGDQFVTDGGDVLVPRETKPADAARDAASRNGQPSAPKRFYHRHERDFDRIEWHVGADGTSFWETTDSDGVTSVFGRSAAARIADPADATRIFRWMIEERYDTKGNRIVYTYESDGQAGVASLYPDTISYGNFAAEGSGPQAFAFQIRFLYALDQPARPDPVVSFRPSFELRVARLCHGLDISHCFPGDLGAEPIVTARTAFHYDTKSGVSLLTQIRRTGERKDGGDVSTRALPPITLAYTPWQPDEAGFEPLDPDAIRPIPGPIDGGNLSFADLFGDGIPGLLEQGRAGVEPCFWRPRGKGRFEDGGPLPLAPLGGMQSAQQATLLDLTGLGRLDEVVLSSGRAGFYGNDDEAGWTSFEPFASATTDLGSATGQFVDLSGGGRPDFLDAGVVSWRVSDSLGRAGFAAARTLPTPSGIERYSSDSEAAFIGFVDVFGDGLSHLVHATSGSLRVWPSLGHGAFAEPRDIPGFPVFPASVTRRDILFGSFAGAGAADLALVLDDRVEIYRNHGGAGFSHLCRVPLPAEASLLGSTVAADVLGNGTTQLIYSAVLQQPAHSYLDLARGHHPFLLERIDNGMGTVTEITYKTSVDYALADRAAGRPWCTSLPFSVNVVSKIRDIDAISRTVETRSMQYSNGFFDPIDRQFAGFAYVQIQTDRTADETLWHFPSAPREGFLGIGALLTKTWWHVGDDRQKDALRAAMLDAAYNPSGALLLPAPCLSSEIENAPSDTHRLAYKALAGTRIREETYPVGADGKTGTVPFNVVQAAQAVGLIQKEVDGRPAIVVTSERETAVTIYEGDAFDPRTTHNVNVEIDPFGQVLRSLEIGYRRIAPAGHVLLPDQSAAKLLLRTAGFINHSDGGYDNVNGGTTTPLAKKDGSTLHIFGLPFETQSFELAGFLQPAPFYSYDTAREATLACLDTIIPFGQPFAGPPEARLFEWSQDLYWNHGLTAPAPLQECGPQALPYQRRTCVYSDPFVAEYVAPHIDPQILVDPAQGGFAHEHGYWWSPGLAAAYQPSAHFFVPKSFADAFGHATTVRFDAYDLHLQSITDALGHEVKVETDYQALLPIRMTDANGTQTSYRYDPLGQVLLQSIAGHENGEPVGDGPLSGYVPVPPKPTSILTAQDIIARPEAYLQAAGAYFFYDLEAWRANPSLPPFTIALHRRHFVNPEGGGSAPSEIAIQVRYFDGSLRDLAQADRVHGTGPSSLTGDATPRFESRPEEPADDEWLIINQVRYDDHGDPIVRYRPYFATTPTYVAKPDAPFWTITYDGLGREIATLTPMGFLTETRHAAWETTHCDEDDTVKRSPFYKTNIENPALPAAEKAALVMAADFEDTWTASVVDVLGREIQQVQNLIASDGSGAPAQVLKTYAWLDARGETFAFADPRFYNDADPSRPKYFDYNTLRDMGGQVTWETSADAGNHPIAKLGDGVPEIQLHAADGKPLVTFDRRGLAHSFAYDALRQPTGTTIRIGGIDLLVEKIEYGSDPATNTVNRMVASHDQAGVARVALYSILGKPRTQSRQYRAATDGLPDWRGDVALLEKVWTSTQTYDALGEPLGYVAPDGTTTSFGYTRNGWPQAVALKSTAFGAEPVAIGKIESFTPDGEAVRLVLGNGAIETRTYRPATGSLQRILTSGAGGATVQDLTYTYDPVGNVTQCADAVPLAGLAAPAAGDYRYDSLYRLQSATGRRAGTGGAIEPYTRRYRFDAATNLRAIEDDAGARWSTTYALSDSSDHAVTAAMATEKAPDAWFDAAGAMTGLPDGVALEHDALGRLSRARSTDETVSLYQYAADRTRQRKVVTPPGTDATPVQTFYLAPFIATDATASSLVVALGGRMLAVAETAGAAAGRIAYQLDDLIGSVTVRLDAAGALMDRQEFYPFGGTALLDVRISGALEKCFQFGGKELDPASGLHSFPMRYYSSAMGRWIRPDPAGLVDGFNRFTYVGGCPTSQTDFTGLGKWRVVGSRIWNALPNLRMNRFVFSSREIFAQIHKNTSAFMMRVAGQMSRFSKWQVDAVLEFYLKTSGVARAATVKLFLDSIRSAYDLPRPEGAGDIPVTRQYVVPMFVKHSKRWANTLYSPFINQLRRRNIQQVGEVRYLSNMFIRVSDRVYNLVCAQLEARPPQSPGEILALSRGFISLYYRLKSKQ